VLQKLEVLTVEEMLSGQARNESGDWCGIGDPYVPKFEGFLFLFESDVFLNK